MAAPKPNKTRLDDGRIIAAFNACYRDGKAATHDWRTEARELFDLVAGHQWPDEDAAQLRQEQRPAVTFNVSGKFLDALIGLQINNRQEIRYYPREPGDTAINELLTGAAKWMRDEADAEDEETDAFADLLICGMGWTETDIDFDSDPEGRVRIERRDPLLMYWDPSARRKNLADARWMIRVKPYSQAEFEAEWPGVELAQGQDTGPTEDELDLLPHDADSAHLYARDAGPAGQRRSIPVAEYQWYESAEVWKVSSEYGTRHFTDEQWARLEPALKNNGTKYQAEKAKGRRYYRAFICGATLLEAHESPYQEGFTYACMTGKRDRNHGTWYGVGRAIRDPQAWLNVFFSQILYTLQSNAKGGLIVEEGVFTDPRKAESEWARPDSITYVQEGAIAQQRLMPKPVAPYPAGLDKLMEFSLRMLPETSGLNLEIIGMADRVQPGIVEAQRKQSALTVIAWAFDAMRRYYKQHGRLLAYYIREYMSDGRLVRINGPKGQAQYVPLVKDADTYRYDVVVDDAPTSTNLKERVWAVLETLLPALMNMGVMPPPEILDYSPLPSDLVNAWKKALTTPPPPEQVQLQKRKAEAEAREVESKANLNEAKAREAGGGEIQKRADAVKKAAEAGKAMVGEAPAPAAPSGGGSER
jgi:hypothetical protein